MAKMTLRRRVLPALGRERIEVVCYGPFDFGGDLTQQHAARLFSHLYGGRLRHCDELGWLEYRHDLGYWQKVPRSRPIKLARALAGAYRRASILADHAARAAENSEERKALSQRATALVGVASRVSTKSAQDGIITLAAAQLSIRPECFDQEPMLLNLQNGVLDLRTGQVSEHSPGHYFSKVAAVAYEPNADCPLWRTFLEKVQPAEAVRRYLQEVTGMTLSADTSRQEWFLHLGSGANGKSVFLGVLQDLMGHYACAGASSTFIHEPGQSDNNRFATARFVGVRSVFVPETPAGGKLRESLIKSLTGGDTITGENKGKAMFDFRPVAKLHVRSNAAPRVDSMDYGTWRRVRVIPWSVTIPEGQRDDQLSKRLREELPGILNWLIEGAIRWQRDGITTPHEISAAGKTYRASETGLSEWLEECALLDQVVEPTPIAALYDSYSRWVEDAGMRRMAKRTFTDRLKANYGCTPVKCKHARCLAGIHLLGEGEEPENQLAFVA